METFTRSEDLRLVLQVTAARDAFGPTNSHTGPGQVVLATVMSPVCRPVSRVEWVTVALAYPWRD